MTHNHIYLYLAIKYWKTINLTIVTVLFYTEISKKREWPLRMVVHYQTNKNCEFGSWNDFFDLMNLESAFNVDLETSRIFFSLSSRLLWPDPVTILVSAVLYFFFHEFFYFIFYFSVWFDFQKPGTDTVGIFPIFKFILEISVFTLFIYLFMI